MGNPAVGSLVEGNLPEENPIEIAEGNSVEREGIQLAAEEAE